MRIFKEMFVANFKQFVRDKDGLFWTLAFPVIFIFIFGIVFSGTENYSFNLGIVTNSNNQMVLQMVESIESISTFKVTRGTQDEELKALEKGERSLVIVIPEVDFNKVSRGESVKISVFYDATKGNTNQILIPVINQIFSRIENLLTNRSNIFEITPQPVQTRKLSNFDYILPGILAMSLMQLGLFGGLEFLSLRERKIIRGLGVTPLPKSAILSSEILMRLLIAMVQTFLIIFIGYFVFDVAVVGNIFLIAGIVILGALVFTSMGYMLISFSKTMEAGRGLIQVVQFPMMFLSGIFFPIEIMPKYIQPVVKAIPLTYLGDALRQIMLGITGPHSLTTNLLVLTTWLIITMILAIRFWRWE